MVGFSWGPSSWLQMAPSGCELMWQRGKASALGGLRSENSIPALLED